MTFGQMQTEVRNRLNESSTAFFSDADIEDALNDGLAELSDATEWNEREATISVKHGHTYYNLRRLLSDGFLSLRHCWNVTTQKWLTPTEPRELDYHTHRTWEQSSAEPERYFIRGIWNLGFWLKPPQDKRAVRVYFTALPDAMSASGDTPGFPQEFHYGIVEYALSDLLAQQRETKKALGHWQAYTAYETRLRRYADQRQSIDRLNVL